MARHPAARLRSLAWALPRVLLLCGLALLAAPSRPAGADEDLWQPVPPWVFFREPDEEAAAALERMVENTFADLNLVVESRERMVRRYGAWSVPRLARELTQAINEPGMINAALTAAALRMHLGPAPELAPLVRPLLATGRSVEEWRRFCALLALGTFAGPEGVGLPRRRADPLVAHDPVAEARRLLEVESLDLLRGALRDQSWPVRCAAAFALAKTGGARAASVLRQEGPVADAAVGPRMAVLLSRGFLAVGGAHDQDLFVEGLADGERLVRAAAALGAALQVACDHPPAWVDAPGRLLRALASAAAMTGKEDTAEGAFARGCVAWRARDAALWDELLTQAVAPDVEGQVAVAAAQALVGCDDPAARARALAQLRENARALHPAVLASFLLRAPHDGSLAGVEACEPWLSNGGLTPRAARDWDPRWHAVLGLCRGLCDGSLVEPAPRARAVALLEQAVRRGLHRECALLPVLESALAAHGPALAAGPAARLPASVLALLEQAVPCQHGLVARDLPAMAVARANSMAYVGILDLAGLKPLVGRDPKDSRDRDKDGTARRFVQRFLEPWPYFRRIDLLEERGRRPAPQLAFDDPAKVLDRGPR